jgi:hypothetical protein
MPPDFSILTQLLPLEPVFHTVAFGLDPSGRARRMAPGYWEIGASGRCYTREFILQMDPAHFVDAETAGWRVTDHALMPLDPDTYLLTYRLQQGERLTRRATIWQRILDDWQILYHQGTIVAVAKDSNV